MRLLVLAPSYPFPAQDGVQLRLKNLLSRLPTGTEVTLVSFANVQAVQTERLPGSLQGISVRIPLPAAPQGSRASSLVQALRFTPTMLWRFRSEEMTREVSLRSKSSDGVLAVGLQMAQYLPLAPPAVPVALDNYNVESRILARLADTRSGIKRLYWQWEAAKLRVAERKLLQQAGAVFAISDTDRQGMAAIAPRAQLHTLPMDVDVDYFASVPALDRSAPKRFTFVGAFNWHVNEDAACWLCCDVWPLIRAQLPDAELHLVGREPSAVVRELARDESVKVSGTVPDVRSYVGASTALLVPLRYGSGVRSKVLEAFAAGRPVVSTSVGCEGLDLRDGDQLAIADTDAGFANACVRLALEPEYADRLTINAQSFVMEQQRRAGLQFDLMFERVFGRNGSLQGDKVK